MKQRLKCVSLVVMLSAGMAGCTATNITTHTAVIDHKNTGVAPGRMVHEEHGMAAYRKPNSDHVSLWGDPSKALLVAGQEHFKDQNYGLAEESFRKAVEVRSDNATAWLGLAASLDQLGR